jgi:hypothetical protein
MAACSRQVQGGRDDASLTVSTRDSRVFGLAAACWEMLIAAEASPANEFLFSATDSAALSL